MYIYFKISFNFFQLWVIQTFLSLIYFWQFFKMSLTEPQYGCHFTKLHKQTVDYHPTLLSNQQTILVKAVNKIWRISPAFALIVSYIRLHQRKFPRELWLLLLLLHHSDKKEKSFVEVLLLCYKYSTISHRTAMLGHDTMLGPLEGGVELKWWRWDSAIVIPVYHLDSV